MAPDPTRIVVLGAGFAGLWSAVGAARRLTQLGIGTDQVTVTVISATPFHDIRVRNYEADISECRIPLAQVLDPIGVAHLTADIRSVDPANRTVTVDGPDGTRRISYDRLVVAVGSRLARPAIPGLTEYAFDIDTFGGATQLNEHLAALAATEPAPGSATVIVVGAGLTGIEAACEMPGKLATTLAGRDDITPRVLLIDHNPRVGSDMGESARPVIEQALTELGVQPVTGAVYTEVWERQVVASGEVAKKTKQVINTQRIYPPLSGDPTEILAAAEPLVQTRPAHGH